MRYALIMAVTLIECFKFSTILTLQNIVRQMYHVLYIINRNTKGKGRAEPNITKRSKMIVDIPNFI